MNSQNTPVHIRLWHHDFWRLAVANLLLTMSVYMLVPVMPRWLLQGQGLSFNEIGAVMGAFGLGLFLFGFFVSFLVQHYRRNMVCIVAVLLVVCLLALLYYLDAEVCLKMDLSLLMAQRFAFGAFFGLAQMTLTSTLIIDTSESFQRTEANHSAAWFSRFALSLGPLAGLLIDRSLGFSVVLLCAAGCAFCALVLVALVHFPFRTPLDHVPVVSLDRFFLPHGFPLFANLLFVTVAVGILFSVDFSEHFYAMMMIGFLSAILAQRFVFRNAEVKSEVVSGLILLFAALLMMITRTQQIVWYASPLFVGFGIGIIGSRFLLFFIKLSRHCQRGTSQSTFLLGWEGGIACGIGIGLAYCQGQMRPALMLSLARVIVALVMYHFTHNWFVRNKNR